MSHLNRTKQYAGLILSLALLLNCFTPAVRTTASTLTPTDSADLYTYAMPSAYYVPSGGSVTYTVSVGNNGPDTASSVNVYSLLPPGLSVSSTANSYGTCTTTPNGTSTDLDCTLGDLEPYETKTIEVTATATGTTYAMLSADFSASSATPDDNSTNDVAETALHIAAPPLPTPTPTSGDNPLIAFESHRDGNAEIYAIHADGTGLSNLTDESVDEWVFQWSPDGTKLVFERYVEQGEIDSIFVMNADGTGQTQLTGDPDYRFYEPAWSPDGTKIAFSMYSFIDGTNVVVVMNADGTNQIALTDGVDTADYEPQWSPDGTRIAFTGYSLDSNDPAGTSDIFVMDADGTDQLNLTNHTSSNFAPAWSPGGARLAFTSYRDGNREIYLIDDDGTGLSNLTQSTDPDYSPRWSPDGSKLTFYRLVFEYYGAGAGVYVVDDDGSNLLHLGDDLEYNTDPDWSPDGVRLAFSTLRNGVPAINLINAGGTGRVELTTSQFAIHGPRWQP